MREGGGKGDEQRPLTVPQEQFEANWDAIFKRTRKDVVEELRKGAQADDHLVELERLRKAQEK